MKTMKVQVEVVLSAKPTKKDLAEMRDSAMSASDERKSVRVRRHESRENVLVADFLVEKARQIDVVDGIGQAFEDFMTNYADSTIRFPK